MKNIIMINKALKKYDKKDTYLLLFEKIIKGIMPCVFAFILTDIIKALMNNDLKKGVIYAAVFCFSIFISWLINELQNKHMIRITSRLKRGLQAENIEKINNISLELLENPLEQDLKERVFDEGEKKIVAGYISLLEFLEEIITILIIAFIVGSRDFYAGGLIIILDLPIIFLAYQNGKKTYKENKEATKHKRYYTYLNNLLLSREYVNEQKIFGSFDFFHRKWENEFEKARKLEMHNFLKFFLSIRVAVILEILVVVLLLASMGKILWSSNAALFIALSGNIISVLHLQTERLPFCITEYSKVIGYLEDRREFFSLKEKDNTPSLEVESDNYFCIELKNLSFRYPGTDKYIIKDINLKMYSNKHYAFVGENGSGKTTLARLILGMYQNYDGYIYINGNEMRECSNEYIRKVFSVVFQDFSMYPLTVKENLEIGCDGQKLKGSEVEAILQSIGLYDKVSALPQKWDTLLWKKGDSYSDLSLGQWQRLAIGRSICSSAPFRVLDEPTASIDPVEEKKFYEQYNKICNGYGTILISHRLASVKFVDNIIVLENGIIKEYGNHFELMKKKGLYYKMYNNQEKWYVEKSKLSMEDSI